MRYISTRGGMAPRTFREILLEGLATDGGLALPESYPRYTASDLARLRKLNYRDLAFDILSRFIDDIPAADLKALMPQVVPIYEANRDRFRAAPTTTPTAPAAPAGPAATPAP